jgi:outer membrane biosynthesis protein TonB
MKSGLTISCVGHAAALIFGLLAISAHPIEAPAVETLPVSFISDKDFTQMTKGVKNAPQLKIPDPKPLADKVAPEKSVDQLAPKVADKPEIKTDINQSKPEPKPQPKQADKQPPDKPKPPDYKPDQIADLLKKDTPKDQPKPDDKPAPQQAKTSPKFDANQVAQLLDKREPQRQVASADAINDKPTLGAAAGAQGAQLSQSEIDALRARISSCWSPPPGIDANSKLYVVLRVLFKPDATVAQEPVLVEGTAAALGPALAESAKRSLLLCQPFTMLKPEHYSQWKDIELKFDPHELLGG